MRRQHLVLLLVNLALVIGFGASFLVRANYEFIVSACIPESGVGGYENTSLDLCADLVGAVLGLLYIRLRYSSNGAARPAN